MERSTDEDMTHEERLDAKAEETAEEVAGMFHIAEPLMLTNQEVSLQFYQDQEEVGRFWYDTEAKAFMFEGDKEKSATEFVAWCLVTFREQLKERYIEKPSDTAGAFYPLLINLNPTVVELLQSKEAKHYLKEMERPARRLVEMINRECEGTNAFAWKEG